MVSYQDEAIDRINKEQRDSGISSLKLYFCRFQNCDHAPFKVKTWRDNHEKNIHKMVQKDESVKKEDDYKYNYVTASLTFNLLLRDINDAIKEGDGARLLTLYKVALLYFKKFGHTKYAFTVLKLLCRIKMEPQCAFRLIWQRFINTKGKKGHNISLDLHLEHLNGFLKEQLKNLRSNLTEANALRVSQSVGNLQKIVEKTKESFGVKSKEGYRSNPNVQKSVRKLSSEMLKVQLFRYTPGREYPSFPKFKSNQLSGLDMNKLFKWIKSRQKEFKKIYK